MPKTTKMKSRCETCPKQMYCETLEKINSLSRANGVELIVVNCKYYNHMLEAWGAKD